jgi:MFS family permease
MGLTFGPMGALLPELFPTEVRYTGASFSYNVSSILGASVAPYIAAWLQGNYGLMRSALSGGHGGADADCAAADPRNAPSVAVTPFAPGHPPGRLLRYFFICDKIVRH